jgi:hypothetical protein
MVRQPARFWRSVTGGFLPLNAIEIAPILRTLAGVARTSPLQFRSINCNTTRLGPHEVDNGDSISRVCFNKSQLARYNIRPCPPPIPPRLHFLRTTPTESLISRSTFLSNRRCRNVSFYFRLFKPFSCKFLYKYRLPSFLPATMKFFCALFTLVLFLTSLVLGQIVTQSDGEVFSFTVSGTVTQTYVLQTTVVTSCGACSATGSSYASSTAPSTAAPSVSVQATSGGNALRPQIMAAGVGLIAGLVFVLT